MATSWGYDRQPMQPAVTKPPSILYEYPFNERVRTYLRVEHLFRRLMTLVNRDDALDHHFALHTLFETIDVASRADMKADVLKDLEKQKQLLNSYRGNPAISEPVLDQVIAQIELHYSSLSHLIGKTGHTLTENEWLMGIRSRIVIPGGTCSFDVPTYFDWQHQAAEDRRKMLTEWCSTVKPLADAIAMLLQMLRDSGITQRVVAIGGHFQQTLPQGRTFQLLRLKMDQSLGLIPEISGNRLMVSVRLVRMGADGRSHSHVENSSFELALCS